MVSPGNCFETAIFCLEKRVRRNTILVIASAMVLASGGLVWAVLSGAAMMPGCPMGSHLDCAASVAATAPASQPATQAATYTCPMHPEVISDKAGKCPKCGMELVKKAEPPATNAGAEHSGHEMHMH
jgi:hypothetical protein